MAEEIYDASIKVVSQKGYCAMGHKIGDEWIIGDNKESMLIIPILK